MDVGGRATQGAVAERGRSRTSLCSTAPVHPCTLGFSPTFTFEYHPTIFKRLGPLDPAV